ncbi:MAG: YlmC/YmxH family sporulation protein, partial [Blautia obeum]|nr:YlmC/YmxH family sporulation protein [Blautia obeum]
FFLLPGKFCFFPGRESEYIIPWCCICQIGDDIILVEVKEEKCFHKDHLL